MNIKTFIVGGVVGMVVALLCVVVVWLYLQGVFVTTAPSTSTETATNTPAVATSTETQAVVETATATASGVPARDLPLTDGQRQLAESLGINVEQVVISQAVIDCARETLGTGRYEQIIAGDTPTMLESARLLPCLR